MYRTQDSYLPPGALATGLTRNYKMLVRTIKGNRLFWKITAVFTGLLIVLGIVFVIIASKFSRSYYTTAHQELYGDIARHLATFTQPFKNGRPDTSVTQ